MTASTRATGRTVARWAGSAARRSRGAAQNASSAAPVSGSRWTSERGKAMTRVVYIVKGMSGEHCVHAIRNEVFKIERVEDVSVDLLAKTVAVTGDLIDSGSVRAAIAAAGYRIIGTRNEPSATGAGAPGQVRPLPGI